MKVLSRMAWLASALFAMAVLVMGGASAGYAATHVRGNLTCTTQWDNPSGGSFENAADWSGGAVPGGSDVACITMAGSYTVDMTQGHTLAGLMLGGAGSGTQTLDIQGGITDLALDGASAIGAGGVLELDSVSGGYSDVSGSGTLTNSGTLTAVQDAGGTRYIEVNFVNETSGTVSIGAADTRVDAGTDFTNNGNISVAASGGLTFSGSSTLEQAAGTITGTITLTGGNVADSGGTGGTLLAECGTSGLSGTIPAGQSIQIEGGPCGSAVLSLSGTTVTNDGTITLGSTTTSQYAQLSGNAFLDNNGTLTTVQGGGNTRYLEVNFVNETSGTVSIGAADTRVDAGTDFTNNGNISVAASGGLTFSGSSTLEQAAGTITGTITLTGGNVADSGGTGGTLLAACGTSGLSGTIPAGQTVQIEGGPCGSAILSLSGTTVTNKGTIKLESTTSSAYAQLSGNAFLSNKAALTTVKSKGLCYIEANLTSAKSGRITIGANTRVDAGTDFTNDGKIKVAASGGLTFSGGSTLEQAAGTITGTITLTGGNVADSGGTGGTLLAACGTSGLSGTIPAGQSIQIEGGPCGSAVLSLSGTTVTNDGTITLGSTTTSQYAQLSGNAFLDNNGTLTTVQGGGNTRYLEVNFVNETSGTVSIGAADTRVDAGTDFTNNGAVTVADGDGLAFSGGSVFTQGSAGTLGVTINATTGSGYGISGNTVNVAGTLAVTTIGTPSAGSSYTVISATNLAGRFTSIQSSTSYTPTYSATSLTLTAK